MYRDQVRPIIRSLLSQASKYELTAAFHRALNKKILSAVLADLTHHKQ